LDRLVLKKHPAKTFIARMKKGIDLPGQLLERKCVRIAHQTLKHFFEHITQLFGQDADVDRIGQYVWL